MSATVRNDTTSIRITGLLAGTTYYYRAYIVNNQGETNYGQVREFTLITGFLLTADLTLYALTATKTLYFLDARTGKQIWAFTSIDKFTFADNALYVAADKTISCLEARSGINRWEIAIPNNLRNLMVVNDLLYAIDSAGKLIAIETATGKIRWTFVGKALFYALPTIKDGVLYITSSKTLYALSATTGQTQWKSTADVSTLASPAVANGTVYAMDLNGGLVAFDASTGQKRWDFLDERSTYYRNWSSPFVANGLVYFTGITPYGEYRATFFALDAATGQKRWTYLLSGGYLSATPILAKGLIHIGSYGEYMALLPDDKKGLLTSLDAITGEKRWALPDDKGLGSPVSVDGVLYIGNTSPYPDKGISHLYALAADTGKQLWSFELGEDLVGSALLVRNGSVVGTYPTDSGAGR